MSRFNSPQLRFGELLERLQKKNIPVHDSVLPELEKELQQHGKQEYPAAVRILIVLGAWIGAGLIGTFLVAFVLPHNETALTVCGTVCLLVSLALPRLRLLPVATEPFALALSIMGISMLMAGLDYDIDDDDALHNLFIALIELLIAVFTVSRVQRTTGIMGFFGFLALYAYYNLGSPAGVMLVTGFALLVFTLLLVYETRLPGAGIPSGWYRPVLTGVTVILPLLFLFTLIKTPEGYHTWKPEDSGFTGWWPLSVPAIAALLFSLWTVFHRHYGFNRARTMTLLLLALLCLAPMAKAPGIIASLLLITCGFASGQRLTVGLGVLALVFYCIAFYYMMETTLLVKSVLMMVSGVLLITAALIFHFLKKRI